MMTIAEIRQLIGGSQLEEALQEMQKLAASQGNSRLGNTLTLLNGQFSSNERNNRIGLLTPADYNRTRNRITHGLLETLDDMTDSHASTGPEPISSPGVRTPQPAQNTPVPSGDAVTTVVFLASNPMPSADLQLDKEYGRITQKLNKSKDFQKFRILFYNRITPSLFIEHLETPNLDIVHFSGHGENAQEQIAEAMTRAGRKEVKQEASKAIESGILLLQEDKNLPKKVSKSFIKSVFTDAQQDSNNSIKAVVFNACHSQEIALAVSEVVEHVVGTSWEVGDEAAIAFAQTFYDTIAKSGKTGKDIDIKRAVRRGITAAQAYDEPRDRFRLYKNGKLVEI